MTDNQQGPTEAKPETLPPTPPTSSDVALGVSRELLMDRSLDKLLAIVDGLIKASGADGKLSTEFLAGEIKKGRELDARMLSEIARQDAEIIQVKESLMKARTAYKDLKDWVVAELAKCKRIDAK
jgi:hypothetical protein